MTKHKLNVVQPEEPIQIEVLAESIVKLSKFGEQLKSTKLKERTILLLLHDTTKVPMREIKTILDALPTLAKKYIK